ncbi:MAG: hypothetical protein A3D74_00840 [Candidatus Levybacteria bacterium RIFCSPHIGHO2_02_FULL_37_13]|nr:MAG: hypothetical protein A3D74_00840 [Candidatus Levybacteria bacterium RIFCSPHIGHO2_02_FULL_37_13]OGH39383.1 MAG: hypothetical protein A3B41_02250 [Candidatus Levybacteria bacterium RIFCSPLOWO2_01_FULL_37_26]
MERGKGFAIKDLFKGLRREKDATPIMRGHTGEFKSTTDAEMSAGVIFMTARTSNKQVEDYIRNAFSRNVRTFFLLAANDEMYNLGRNIAQGMCDNLGLTYLPDDKKANAKLDTTNFKAFISVVDGRKKKK